MNKFFAISIVALVGATVCLAADDSREIGLLLGHENKFADFCLRQRDEIQAAIESQVNGRTRDVFEIFFGAATEIADEVLTVEMHAVEEFAKELKSPTAGVQPDAPLPENEIQRLIEQGKRDIAQQSNMFGRLVAAGKYAVGGVLYNVANSAIFVRLAKARSYMNRENLLYGIVQTCDQVAKFDDKIAADFETTKAELLAKYAGDVEVTQTIQDVTAQNLKCYTTKYISRVEAFCSVFKNGAGAFMKMLGLGSNYQLPSEITMTKQ